jgi:hypothetical protein
VDVRVYRETGTDVDELGDPPVGQVANGAGHERAVGAGDLRDLGELLQDLVAAARSGG